MSNNQKPLPDNLRNLGDPEKRAQVVPLPVQYDFCSVVLAPGQDLNQMMDDDVVPAGCYGWHLGGILAPAADGSQTFILQRVLVPAPPDQSGIVKASTLPRIDPNGLRG